MDADGRCGVERTVASCFLKHIVHIVHIVFLHKKSIPNAPQSKIENLKSKILKTSEKFLKTSIWPVFMAFLRKLGKKTLVLPSLSLGEAQHL